MGFKPRGCDSVYFQQHEVCSHGFEDIAGLLLRHGAVVDPMAGSNETPLHDAVTQGQIALVRLLRTWGADDTVRNLHGHTPRYCWCFLWVLVFYYGKFLVCECIWGIFFYSSCIFIFFQGVFVCILMAVFFYRFCCVLFYSFC